MVLFSTYWYLKSFTITRLPIQRHIGMSASSTEPQRLIHKNDAMFEVLQLVLMHWHGHWYSTNNLNSQQPQADLITCRGGSGWNKPFFALKCCMHEVKILWCISVKVLGHPGHSLSKKHTKTTGIKNISFKWLLLCYTASTHLIWRFIAGPFS